MIIIIRTKYEPAIKIIENFNRTKTEPYQQIMIIIIRTKCEPAINIIENFNKSKTKPLCSAMSINSATRPYKLSIVVSVYLLDGGP